jgi:tRNA-2-methylthio-N6-dimethylallyladenosine synthase
LGEGLKEKAPVVDYVMGTDSRVLFAEILGQIEQGLPAPANGIFQSHKEKPVFSFSELHYENESPYKAFVPIMHGCNNFCSYCIVPYVRGREVSRSPGSILDELHVLAEKGVCEVTLLGQNVNSYRREGSDASDFPSLLEKIAEALEGTSIKRLRFISSHPKDLSDETIAVMARHSVFCRSLHLPVQHGSNRILAAMNRHYTGEDYLALVKKLRTAMPDINLTTDILIGFPGETEEDVQKTLALMEEVRFGSAFMYHYNPREGTAAYALEGRIPDAVKKERLGRIIALQKRHTQEHLRQRLDKSKHGSRENVLIEGISKKNADELIGRLDSEETVVFKGKPSLIGSFAEVKLLSLKGNTFRGEIIEE